MKLLFCPGGVLTKTQRRPWQLKRVKNLEFRLKRNIWQLHLVLRMTLIAIFAKFRRKLMV